MKKNLKKELLLESQVCFALYSTSKTLIQAYAPLLEKLDLTYLQYIVMLVLWEEDNTPLKDIGQRLFLDSGTLTPLLKKLEKNGLINRTRSEKDEREIRITLTKKGLALKNKAEDIPKCIFEKSGLSISELEALKIKLKELREHLLNSL